MKAWITASLLIFSSLTAQAENKKLEPGQSYTIVEAGITNTHQLKVVSFAPPKLTLDGSYDHHVFNQAEFIYSDTRNENGRAIDTYCFRRKIEELRQYMFSTTFCVTVDQQTLVPIDLIQSTSRYVGRKNFGPDWVLMGTITSKLVSN